MIEQTSDVTMEFYGPPGEARRLWLMAPLAAFFIAQLAVLLGPWIGLALGLPMVTLLVWAGLRLKLPFATLGPDDLTLRPQIALPAVRIPLVDISGFAIADNYSRTITIERTGGSDYRCHGWRVLPEDGPRLVAAVLSARDRAVRGDS